MSTPQSNRRAPLARFTRLLYKVHGQAQTRFACSASRTLAGRVASRLQREGAELVLIDAEGDAPADW